MTQPKSVLDLYHKTASRYYKTKDEALVYLNDLKVDASLIECFETDEQNFRFLSLAQYCENLLPSLSEQQKGSLANELVGEFVGLGGGHYPNWHTMTAKQRKDAVQAMKDNTQAMLEQGFKFLAQHQLVPSPKCFGDIFWRIREGSIAGFAELYNKHGKPLVSQSNEVTDFWSTCFFHSAQTNYQEFAQWLARHNLFPKMTGFNHSGRATMTTSDSIFSLVVRPSGVDILKLLPVGQLKKYANHPNNVGQTPIHHATKNLLPEFVEYLIELGANKNPVDHKGRYPMDLIKRTTSRVENIGRIQELLGGSISKTPEQVLEMAVKKFDTTFLKKALEDPAIAKRANETLMRVLDEGIGNSQPAVFKKMYKRRQEMVETLLPFVDLSFQDKDGNTFLHAAFENGVVETVDLLLEKSKTLNDIQNKQGTLPFCMLVTGFDKPERNWGDQYQSWIEIYQIMSIDTSKRLLKVYQKHDIRLTAESFVAFRAHKEGAEMNNKLLKLVLKQELGSQLGSQLDRAKPSKKQKM